ncbi:MAG: SGNH/GDSL hydrolase family protein [Pseudomonadota bacterium]
MASSPRPTRSKLFLTWLLFPVYAWQGLAIRRKTPRMQPPPNKGQYDFSGGGEKLKLLVIGDSSAAGVGVDSIEQSFAYLLPQFLNKATKRPVHVRIAGMNSAVSAQIRDYVVPNIEHQHFDYIALNIGINDTKNFHRGNQFCRDFGTLLYALRSRFPGAVIIWSGIPDMQAVPALPSPLNWILGVRSRLLDRNGRILCRERGALAPEPEWRPLPENFSSDRFHASEAGYREWAENLSAYILELEKQKIRRGK